MHIYQMQSLDNLDKSHIHVSLSSDFTQETYQYIYIHVYIYA